MASIRGRLVLGTVVGTSLALLVGGLLLYAGIRASLVEQVDHSLADSARIYASTVEHRRKKGGVETDKLDLREFEAPDRPGFLELWLPDGVVAFRSASLGDADLEAMAGSPESPAFRWVTLPSGRNGRAVGMSFMPHVGDGKSKDGEPKPEAVQPPQRVTLVLARDTAALDGTLTLLRQLLIGGGSITMGLFAGFLWVAIRRGLRPLDRLAARIGEMEEGSLTQPIDLDGLPRELQPVKDRLNDLLGRLESGMKRERALSADMAHELRSPLAGLRATIEVALSRPRAPEQYCEAFTDGLRITGQMQSLVENLLSMARLEAGQIDIRPETVALNEVVQSHLAPIRDAIQARDLKLQWDPGRAATVVTDPALVGAVVRNVLENAATYTNEGGAVRIDATQTANGAKLKVSNSGSALTEDQVVHVFDRFWRGDASRGMNGSHCGLGLALVKRMVDVLGGEVKATSSAGGTFEISLSIPSARAAKGPGDATPCPRP